MFFCNDKVHLLAEQTKCQWHQYDCHKYLQYWTWAYDCQIAVAPGRRELLQCHLCTRRIKFPPRLMVDIDDWQSCGGLPWIREWHGMGTSWVATLFVAPNQMLKLYKCFRLEQKCKINASMGQGRLAAIATFKTVEARRDQEVPRNLQRFRCNYIHSSCGLCHQSWQTSAYNISAKYQIRLSWKSYFWTSHWLSVFYAFAPSSAMKLRS